MSDYKAFIFHVNREDLLKKAVDSVEDIWKNLTVVDNSDNGLSIALEVPVLRPPVPLTAVQSINLALTSTKRQGAKICLWMHNDAEAHIGSAMALVTYARRLNAEGRKWGVLFTNYDALSATSIAMVDEVGLWDTVFTSYFGDNDAYYRFRKAGYELIDTGIPVDHIGSQTIRSDPEREFLNSVTFPIYEAYYQRKHGGGPGRETFQTPFNR